MEASGGNRGYAVVQLEGNRILAVREGADISPGMRLLEVHAEQIIVQRNGGRATLALPEKGGRTQGTGAPPQAGTPAESAVRHGRY